MPAIRRLAVKSTSAIHHPDVCSSLVSYFTLHYGRGHSQLHFSAVTLPAALRPAVLTPAVLLSEGGMAIWGLCIVSIS